MGEDARGGDWTRASGSGPRPAAGPAEFAPRPYPRRAPGHSPVRGRSVLVVDPDVDRGRQLSARLSSRGAAARHHDGGDGLGQLLTGPDRIEVIVVRGSDVDDEDLDALRGIEGGPAILLVGAAGLAESHDASYVAEDASDEQVATGVARALESRALAHENRELRAQLDDRFSFGRVVTRDPGLREVLRTLESVADTRATVLILGETGTGKSMLARTLHQSSSRRAGPYVEVNCGALPAGLLEAELFGHAKGAFTGASEERAGRFEAADGGTIFLDEIDSAPLELQVKLLRVVQDRLFERVGETRTREVDVRIVAATNADLETRVAEGEFREDLYWRLKVVEVELPALRARARDLAPLAESFVERFAEEYDKPVRGLSPAALGVLAALPWPGNVRQLENALERAVLLARTGGEAGGARRLLEPADLDRDLVAEAARSTGEVGDLPRGLEWLADIDRVVPLKEALEGPERLLIERALTRNGGRRDRAAQDLGINRSTLFNKMRKYDLLEAEFGGPDA